MAAIRRREINVGNNKGGAVGNCVFVERNTVRHELDMNIVLTPVDILGTLEEARHIVLENGERLVQLLEDADNSVVLLNVLLCLSHRYLCIEASEEKENG